MKRLILFIILFALLGTGIAKAQYTDLYNFPLDAGTTNTGASPNGSLTLWGGILFGVTIYGGVIDNGVIFSYDPVWNAYTDQVDFTGTSGANPGSEASGSLTLLGGIFYGMTNYGGANGYGVIFSYNPVGNVYTDLVDFTDSVGANPGAYPQGSLTLSDGVFYGMTAYGGVNGWGVIFSYDPVENVYTDLVDFTGIGGANPGAEASGSLTLWGSIFYGMTNYGGANYAGVIFSYNPVGNVYTDLVNFTGNNGANPGSSPYGSLTLSGSVFYGTTSAGGTNGDGVIFSYNPSGNVYTDLINLTGTGGACRGSAPSGSLILSGGLLYDMTKEGGANGDGVIFSYNPVGNIYTALFDFTGSAGANPGASPLGSLTLYEGFFYGMTSEGGTNNEGVIFSFNDSTAGINNINAGAGIKLFPNPNNGVFTIQSFANQSLVDVYNLLGEKVFTQTLSPAPGNNNINISDQPDGVYLYRILDEGGALSDQGRIVIER